MCLTSGEPVTLLPAPYQAFARPAARSEVPVSHLQSRCDRSPRFWLPLHPVELGEVDEFQNLDHIGSNLLVFDCQLVGQPGRTWTIGSGRGDKDLDVQVLVDHRQGSRVLSLRFVVPLETSMMSSISVENS